MTTIIICTVVAFITGVIIGRMSKKTKTIVVNKPVAKAKRNNSKYPAEMRFLLDNLDNEAKLFSNRFR